MVGALAARWATRRARDTSSARPSRVVGAAIGMIAITGVLVFTGGIGRIYDHLVPYGWNWDVQVGSALTQELTGAARAIGKDPSVSELAAAAQSGLQIRGLAVDTLATSVRRRRRDLSVLEVFGFVRGQVMTTAAWQSATLVVLAGAIGVPLGVLAGRFAWSVFADRLGVSTSPTIPLTEVALLVPVLLLLGGLIAAVPGRLAARTRPAVGLRAE